MTTSEIEYLFVADPAGGLQELGIEAWPQETVEFRAVEEPQAIQQRIDSLTSTEIPEREEIRRRPIPLTDFRSAMEERNELLRARGFAPLLEVEALATRLCSHPAIEAAGNSLGWSFPL